MDYIWTDFVLAILFGLGVCCAWGVGVTIRDMIKIRSDLWRG